MTAVPGQQSGGKNRKSGRELRLAGQFRPDRHADRTAPAPVADTKAGAPAPPTGLTAASRRVWLRLCEEYLLTSAPQLELLESALRSRDVAERAREALERDGLTFTDKHGQPRAHPAAAIHRDARAAFVTTMRVLGFPGDE